ncbi:MAG: Gfo/Idh/MocA family protein [Bacteroidota bacterium]
MRFFVLGVGSIGVRHIRNLQSLGFTDIIAYDANAESLKKISDDLGIKTAGSLPGGIAERPDAALVCLPNHLHIDASIELAMAGIHLFIEKPLDLSLARVDELIALIEQKSLIDMVACNFRFDAGLRMMKERMENGSIGRILRLQASFGQYLPDWRPSTDYRKNYAAKKETGGGVILDRIHEFDYVHWLMGTVASISGYASRIGDLEIETEDNADVIYRHTTGAVSNIHVDYLRREYQCSCEVSGSEGIMVWNFKQRSLLQFEASNKQWTDLSADIPADINDMYVKELKYFTDCVASRNTTFNTVVNAAEVLRTVLITKEMIVQS